jgi:glutamate/tyrosine decarboxylase-like PLP-dependent enzyme
VIARRDGVGSVPRVTDRLPPHVVERLRRRLEELAPLGSLASDGVAVGPEGERALSELAGRLAPTFPYSEPTYAGQMLKPPHPVAWAAYAATMLLNPNNHSLDGGPATSELEREAVQWIAEMIGLDAPLAHLTSSGTVANLEALWIARELHPDRTVVSGANAHYTHERLANVIGLRHEQLPEDARGRIDLDALENRLRRGGVGTVVVTAGTTSLGAIDDVDAAADICAAHGARLHVDAAYGGFFTLLADGGEPAVEAGPFRALARADSVVVDPHKHGLQPYGCGCVLFADPGVARFYLHDSPYTYFSSRELHPGETTLECSRPGAAAAALWATLRALPLTRQGLGSHLAGARRAALALAERMKEDLELVVEPQLDIVCAFPRLRSAAAVTEVSERAFAELADSGWHVAKLRLETAWLRRSHPWVEPDAATTTVLRLCLMKPEHLAVVDELAERLRVATSPR